MDGSTGGTGTAQSWFAVAGQQASRPLADKAASAIYLRWPRVSVLELGAFRDAVPCARRHVRGALGEWGVPLDVTEDMELICAELVTNAIQATVSLERTALETVPPEAVPPEAVADEEPRPIGLRLLGNWQRVVLEVWDCHPAVPVRRTAPDDQECGRGLAIVHELANRWGSRRLSAHVKAVWAELLLPARQPK